MSPLIFLTPWDLAIAAGLVVVAGLISVALRLGLERRLAISAVRTVVQLGLAGLILEYVFELEQPVLVGAAMLVMTLFAARETVRRARRRYARIHLDGWLAMAASGLIVCGVVTQVVIGVAPWYSPQYVIPLFGMILGNAMNGIALCLDRFLEHLFTRRHEVELQLAFGATRGEALRDPLRTAVRTGMIPIINGMAAVGIVSLPGMMTGQILGGSPPLQAVAYQIVVMFMLAAAVSVGAILAAVVAGRRLVGPDGRLRLERLHDTREN